MDPVPGREALTRLLTVLASQPAAAFARIGGPVSFFVKGKDGASAEHHFAVVDGAVALVAGKPERWAVRVGISASALDELVSGTLEVQRAIDENRLAIDAAPDALARFAAVFTPKGSALDVRLRR